MRFLLLHLLIYWRTIATLDVAGKTISPWNATEMPGNETEESTGLFYGAEITLSEEEKDAEKIPNFGTENLQRGDRKLEEKNDTVSDDKACGPSPFVENASPSDSKQSSFPVGSVVTYSCEFGYVSTGSKRSTTCHISSETQQTEWTRMQLKCSPRSCGDPGYVPNGQVVGSLFTFPNNVTIQCDEGYERRGQRTRFCQANGEWSGSLATCIRILCPEPSSPFHGRAVFSSLEYGSALRYECEKGFKLDRKEPRLCDKSGRWSGIEPTCSEMYCEPPAAPGNGSVQILDEGLKPGSLILYACDEGRTLVGSARSTCSEDGQWIFPTPRCVVPCVVPRILNGVMGKYVEKGWRTYFKKSLFGSEVNENEYQIIRCDPEYFIAEKNSEEAEVLCSNGKWSTNLTCVSARCAKDPPPAGNAYVHIKDNAHGGTVTYLCNTLYSKKKTGNVTCLFGQWEGIPPVCEKRDCLVSELNDPGLQGSQRVYKNGYSYDPSCKQGYETSMVANKLVCRKGKWIGHIPPCQPASCRSDPPWVSNARAIPDCRTHECSVTYICNPPFMLKGRSTVRCLYGSWEGDPPICSNDKCYVPRISNGEVGRYVSDYYGRSTFKKSRPGEEMSASVEYILRCYNNYHVVGSKSNEINAVCTDGALSENLQCTSASCTENPPPTANAYVTFKSQRHGGTVTYECQDKFEKKKYGNITCLFGYWEGITPICQGIGTSNLPLMKEEEKYVTAEDRAQIESTSTAPANTESLEIKPECTCQYSTTDQQLLAYVSDRKIVPGSKIRHGSTVMFGCQNFGYYKLVGEPKIVCATCGQTMNSPKCEPPVQGDTDVRYVGDLKVGGINLLEVKKGGRLQLTCYALSRTYIYPTWTKPSERHTTTSSSSQGYLSTTLDITSLRDEHSGEYICGGLGLTSTILNVRVVEPNQRCPSFPISGKYIITYEHSEGKAYFHCKEENQKLRGANVLHCNSNGQWSGEAPDCIDVECSELTESDSLTIQLTDGKKVGSIATFRCLSPLELKGNASLTCLRNGTWSAETPTCVLPNCFVDELYSLLPEFMHPVMENVDEDTVPFGSNFTLQCEDDQQITQPATATCSAGGKWVIPSVRCISGCGPFVKDSNSVVITEPQQDFYRLGEQILLSCPPGLTLTREIEVVMCFGGKWSEVDIPDCQ